MGARGPVPNRTDDLSRSRDANRGDRVDVTKGTALPVVWPEPDPEWHPISLMLWDAAQESGQAAYYQQTDIVFLYSICEDLSKYKSGAKRSGQMLQTIYSSMSNLLVTEGDRRRLRIELEAPVERVEDAGVVALDAYKKALSGGA